MSKSGWGLGIRSSVGITELWNANRRVVARSRKRFQRKRYDETREWTSCLLVRRNVREEEKISPVGRERQYLCLPSHFLFFDQEQKRLRARAGFADARQNRV